MLRSEYVKIRLDRKDGFVLELKKMLQLVSKETGTKTSQAEQVIKLLEEGNTVPFIARYRKEQTGWLDEVQIKTIEDRYHYIQQLEQRKEEVLRLIEALVKPSKSNFQYTAVLMSKVKYTSIAPSDT